MFHRRVAHTHTVHRQKARITLACALVMLRPAVVAGGGAGEGDGLAGVSITGATVPAGSPAIPSATESGRPVDPPVDPPLDRPLDCPAAVH
jgi:hypothetical protein